MKSRIVDKIAVQEEVYFKTYMIRNENDDKMTDNRNEDGKVLTLVMMIRMVLNNMTMILSMTRLQL